MSEKGNNFRCHGPIPIQFGEASKNASKNHYVRCAIVDLSFQHPSQIGELVFRNYYTASVSVYAKKVAKKLHEGLLSSEGEGRDETDDRGSPSPILNPSNRTRHNPSLERSFSATNDISGIGLESRFFCPRPGTSFGNSRTLSLTGPSFLIGNPTRNPGREYSMELSDSLPRHSQSSFAQGRRRPSLEPFNLSVGNWELCIESKCLMPHPHFETGSQDYISIPMTESLAEWRDIIALRIILYQPSTVWARFSIEEVKTFKQFPKRELVNSAGLMNKGSWFSILRQNTKAIMGGKAVEPENNSPSDDELVR